ALPLFDGWPLRHGYGGLLGDGLLHLVVKLFSAVNEERAPLAAGLVLLAAAIQMSGRAIGFEPETFVKSALRAVGKALKDGLTKPRVHAQPVPRDVPDQEGSALCGWPWAADRDPAHTEPAASDLNRYEGRHGFHDTEPSLGPIYPREDRPAAGYDLGPGAGEP